MPQDTATQATESDCEVMASVDSDDEGTRLIIAELCREDAWVSMATDAALDVESMQ